MTEEAPPAAPAIDPAEMQATLEAHKGLVITFQERLFERFKDYILGVSLLPPREEDKGKIPILLLIDDAESTKTPKDQLRDKLLKLFDEEAQAVDEKLLPEVLLLSDLWQYCYDGKYEVLADIASSLPTYDVGMLQAFRLIEVHKNMVLKKFEKYIVAYVLGGSITQGTATTESDVDVFIVIDDTDVKKMTRAELRDKLRAIIIDMGFQAGEMTGVKNKINIQPYILTDFWDNIKEAHPVIFTFLRDGVPLYDRGIFMPWKQLLQMGRVKPSPEAIDVFMSSGEQMLKRTRNKLREIGIEDFFWATTTPAQAAIMMYGYPPPTPKELTSMLRQLFVDGEPKLLDEEYVAILDHILEVRKDMEHGKKVEITGTEIDELYNGTQKFLKRMNELFTEIQEEKDKEAVLHTYENTITITRDVLRAHNFELGTLDVVHTFNTELVKKGLVPEKYTRILKDIMQARVDYDANKLTKVDMLDINKKGREFYKHMLDFLQRSRGRELERAKIRVKHGELFGEVLLLDTVAYVIHDLQNPEKEYQKAVIRKDGSLGKLADITEEEYEQAIAHVQLPEKVFIKEPLFEDLKRVFGKDVQVLVTQ